MKALLAGCTASVVSLVVLVVVYLDHFGQPFLGLPKDAAAAIALSVLAVNTIIAVVAITFRRRGPAVAWSTTALALTQVATVLVTS